MQVITLSLSPSPSMPIEVLDQVFERAEAEGVTPEAWVYSRLQEALTKAEGADREAANPQ